MAGQLMWYFWCPIAWHSFDPADSRMEPIDRSRRRDFSRAQRAMGALLARPAAGQTTDSMKALLTHVRFCRDRARSLAIQLDAQEQLRRGDVAAAGRLIQSALKIDPMPEYQRDEIQKWVEKSPAYAGLLK